MKDSKTFNMRVPKDMWLFLKKTSCEQETSMMAIILEVLNKHKKSYEKKLTANDARV